MPTAQEPPPPPPPPPPGTPCMSIQYDSSASGSRVRSDDIAIRKAELARLEAEQAYSAERRAQKREGELAARRATLRALGEF